MGHTVCAVRHLVLSQLTRVTDGRPDRQTDGRTNIITTPKKKRRIFAGWVKLWSNLKPFVDQSSCGFATMYRGPSVVSNALARLSMTCFAPKI